MRTQFRPGHAWPLWEPDRAALHALVDLCDRTWPTPSEFTFELARGDRIDQAENSDEARQLLDTEGAVAAATRIDVIVLGPHESIGAMTFRWHGDLATLLVTGPDEVAAYALSDRATAILEAGSVEPPEPTRDTDSVELRETIPALATEAVKTEFRPMHHWPHWDADRAALHALVDLCERTWADPRFTFDLVRERRADRAATANQARQLLATEDAIAAATRLLFMVTGSHDSLTAISFDWSGHSATLFVFGRDEVAANALRSVAVEILNAGSVEPSAASVGAAPFEQQTELPLARVRFVGTYADLDQLVRDLADQVRQVRGNLDWVYIAVTEHGHTVKVHDLDELNRITDRDIHQLRHLSVSLGDKHDGPALSLYINVRQALRVRVGQMWGNASGPDEAPVRTLRASANELLRDRGRPPHWPRYWQLLGAGWTLEILAVVLVFVPPARRLVPGAQPLGIALLGMACLLVLSPLYLPDAELLGPGEKTRWSRWSRSILGLVVAWLIGSLAIPLFTR